ncbi:MAG: 50S ribosomal protein L6 [Candidatus Firestonebacteria bacterium]
MARGGNSPINIPNNVKVSLKDEVFTVEGPQGKLSMKGHPEIKVEIKDSKVVLSKNSDEEGIKSLHGTLRAKLANMISGVVIPFTKVLQVEGVGYKAAVTGNKLTLQVGFTHLVEVILPAGISASVEKQTIVTLKGADREVLGDIAAKIRLIKKPDPYKGKGIRYLNEHIRKKVGKTATGVTSLGGGKK